MTVQAALYLGIPDQNRHEEAKEDHDEKADAGPARQSGELAAGPCRAGTNEQPAGSEYEGDE
ncbi:hypothetical protein J31TS4_16630 [Paenibacillus sp. J31TS4]|nr:hypothetical protein J31TS4_16630 [Paenibacillus sp. J31TS4]